MRKCANEFKRRELKPYSGLACSARLILPLMSQQKSTSKGFLECGHKLIQDTRIELNTNITKEEFLRLNPSA